MKPAIYLILAYLLLNIRCNIIIGNSIVPSDNLDVARDFYEQSGPVLAVDMKRGNIYVGMTITGKLDSETYYGNADGLVAKIRIDGTREWTRVFGNQNDQIVNVIRVESETGDLIVGGSTQGGFHGVKAAVGKSLYLIRYKSDGSRVYTSIFGSSKGDDSIRDFIIKSDSNTIEAVGTFSANPAYFRYSLQTGELLKKYSMNSVGSLTRIIEDTFESEMFFVTGYVVGDSRKEYDVFMTKINNIGTRIWQNTYRGTGTDIILDLIYDGKSQTLAAVGATNSPTILGSQRVGTGYSSLMILLNAQGQLKKVYRWGNDHDNIARSIVSWRGIFWILGKSLTNDGSEHGFFTRVSSFTEPLRQLDTTLINSTEISASMVVSDSQMLMIDKKGQVVVVNADDHELVISRKTEAITETDTTTMISVYETMSHDKFTSIKTSSRESEGLTFRSSNNNLLTIGTVFCGFSLCVLAVIFYRKSTSRSKEEKLKKSQNALKKSRSSVVIKTTTNMTNDSSNTTAPILTTTQMSYNSQHTRTTPNVTFQKIFKTETEGYTDTLPMGLASQHFSVTHSSGGGSSVEFPPWGESELPIPVFKRFEVNVHFKIRRDIHKGTSGFISYGEAIAPDLKEFGTVVAIKHLNIGEDELSLFYQEIAALHSLINHKNIVKMLGYTEKPYMVITKFYSLGSLKRCIDEQVFLRSRRMCLQLMHDISTGIRAIHKAGFIHSDITIDNILMDSDYLGSIYAVVSDFESVQVILNHDQPQTKHREWSLSHIKQTSLFYRSPEILKSLTQNKMVFAASTKDFASIDVYAYGILMHQILTAKTDY